MEASLRDDTATLRGQAGRVIQDMPETSSQLIHLMSLDQQAAQRRIDKVTTNAEQTFSELGLLVAQTRFGVDGMVKLAQQLDAHQAKLALCAQTLDNQQAHLHQPQQQHLEQRLQAQQAQTTLTQT